MVYDSNNVQTKVKDEIDAVMIPDNPFEQLFKVKKGYSLMHNVEKERKLIMK